jgi:PAS domain S-box-containing protein
MASARILLVEDEPIIALDIKAMLESIGYEVLDVVDSGEKAITKTEELMPELILMDITLHGKIDGVEATKHIQGKLDMPVIYLTAHTEESTFRRARETAPYGYLVKPLGVSDLYSAIETALHRHTLESRLRESEKRYRDLVENLNEVIYSLDENGIVTYISPIVEYLYGYSPSEIIGSNFLQYIYEEDRESAIEYFRNSLKGIHNPIEHRLVAKDGRIRWFRLSERTIYEDGRAVGTSGVLTDITELKSADEALRESEHRYRDLVENLNDVICSLDENGVITYISPVVESYYGYTVNEIIGKNFIDFIYVEDRQRIIEGFQRSLEDSNRPAEYRAVTKEGLVRWFRVSGRTIYEEGRVKEVHGVLTDITERKYAEEAYKTLVDHSLQGLIIFQEGNFVFANRKISEYLGIPLEEIINKPITDLWDYFHPEDRDETLERYRARLQGEKVPERSEFRIVRRDGTVLWTEVFSHLIDYRGKPAVQTVVIDITEKKRAEEELRESREFLNRILDNITYSIALLDLKTFTYIYGNPQTEKLFGVSPGGFPGLPFGHDMDPERRELMKQVILDEMEHDAERDPDRVRVMVYQHESSKTGKKFWDEITAVFVRDAEGKPAYLLVLERDITEQKDAEELMKNYHEDLETQVRERTEDLARVNEELRQSEERYRLLAENSSDIIWTLNLDGIVTYISPSIEKMSGFKPEEMVGVSLADYAGEERTKAILQDMLRDRDAEGEGSSLSDGKYELELPDRNGILISVELSTSLIYDEKGFVIGFQGTTRDITRRKEAEKALADSEAKYRDLVENINDIIYSIDERGTITYVSPVTEIVGYGPSELIGRSLVEFAHPDDYPILVEGINRLFGRGEPQPTEFRIISKSGEYRWFRALGKAIFVGDEFKGIQGVLTDIHAKKQAEIELAETRFFLQRILDSSPNLIYVYDLMEHRNIYSNPGVLSILGYTEEEVRDFGSNLFPVIIHPDDLDAVSEYHSCFAQADDHEVREIHYRVKRKDGEWIWFHSRDVVFSRSEKDIPTQILGTATDITAWKEVENKLRQARDEQ